MTKKILTAVIASCMLLSITACGSKNEEQVTSSEEVEIRENYTDERTEYSSNKVEIGKKVSAYGCSLALREEKDEKTGYVNVYADVEGMDEPLLLFPYSEGLTECYMIDSGRIAYVIAQANFMDHETKDTWYSLQLLRMSENGVSQTNTVNGKLIDEPKDGMTEFHIRSEVDFCGFHEADRTYYIKENYLVPKEITYQYVNKQKISPVKDIELTTVDNEKISVKAGDGLFITGIDLYEDDDSVEPVVYMEDKDGKTLKIRYSYEYFEWRINGENVTSIFSY